jgi:hypothetical protein
MSLVKPKVSPMASLPPTNTLKDEFTAGAFLSLDVVVSTCDTGGKWGRLFGTNARVHTSKSSSFSGFFFLVGRGPLQS